MVILTLGLLITILYSLMIFLIIMYNVDELKKATQSYRRGYIKLTLLVCALNVPFIGMFVTALFKIQVN